MFINSGIFENLIEESKKSDRKRSHCLLHSSSDDPIQSMLFALQPSTNIGIHRHFNPTETICCLKGEMAVITYYENGSVDKTYRLNAKNPIYKFNPSQWDSYLCLSEDTIGWEIKEGPYNSGNFEKPNWLQNNIKEDYEILNQYSKV